MQRKSNEHNSSLVHSPLSKKKNVNKGTFPIVSSDSLNTTRCVSNKTKRNESSFVTQIDPGFTHIERVVIHNLVEEIARYPMKIVPSDFIYIFKITKIKFQKELMTHLLKSIQ